MNDTTEDNPIEQILEIIIEPGFGGMDQAMTILIHEAMKIERASTLRASAYERTPDRQEHANGDKPKNVKSRLGNLGLQVPPVRGGIEFYPSELDL